MINCAKKGFDMKIIYNGQQIEVEDNITLEQFVSSQGAMGQPFLVNGAAMPASTILVAYNVVEIDATGTMISAGIVTANVDIDLTDFTGHSGMVSTENTISSVRNRYEGAVAISIIRDNQPIQTEELQTGDRVMVMPSGGVKGA